jgi:molybdate transport system regulatory protein
VSEAPGLLAELVLRRGGSGTVGASRMALLAEIGRLGSLTLAARSLGLSYKGAWDAVQALNNLFERPLVAARTGGSGGGSAVLTAEGERVLSQHLRMTARLQAALTALEHEFSGAREEDLDAAMIKGADIRTTVENVLAGVIERIEVGAVNVEVLLRLSEGAALAAMVSRTGWEGLGLAAGDRAFALIQANDIMLAVGEPLAISARNQLSGQVAAVSKGAVNDEIVVEIAPGKTLRAIVTRTSREALGLEPGVAVTALVKAGNVILSV